MSKDKSPVVEVAKKAASSRDEIKTLSSGVRVKLHSVSASLIMDVQMNIKYPPVPIIDDKERGQIYENPNDPSYLRAVAEIENVRAAAAMDAVIMFGVELVDEMPYDNKWIKRLQTLDRAGSIGLDNYDLEDEIDQEFLYKKYIAVRSDDFDLINSAAGVTEEGIEAVEESFPGDA